MFFVQHSLDGLRIIVFCLYEFLWFFAFSRSFVLLTKHENYVCDCEVNNSFIDFSVLNWILYFVFRVFLELSYALKHQFVRVYVFAKQAINLYSASNWWIMFTMCFDIHETWAQAQAQAHWMLFKVIKVKKRDFLLLYF